MPLRRLFLLSSLVLALAAGAAVAPAVGLLPAAAGAALAGLSLPCDIYASAGTPCAAGYLICQGDLAGSRATGCRRPRAG
jgi:hypothetical protein